MTLDEAIKHAKEAAEEYQRVVDTGIVFDDVTIDMLYCDDTEVIEEHLANYRRRAEEYSQLAKWLKELKQTRWIPVSERLPEVNEEAYSNDVLVSLRKTIWDTYKCQMVHITKIASYDKNAISSDGTYMDTEGWVSNDGSTLSMDEVIAWMPLPAPYKVESEECIQ